MQLMKSIPLVVAATALLALGGCATAPTGPSVLVLPGNDRSFNDFRADEAECRQYASQQIGTSPNESTVRGAVIGTVIGAAAGAAIGGHQGAGGGAGTGLPFGTAGGGGSSERRAYGSQRQYDNAYIQCMYGRGHRVPVSGAFSRPTRAPADPNGYPPPPPNYPPPQSVPPDYQPPR
jgi:hypothetical protein